MSPLLRIIRIARLTAARPSGAPAAATWRRRSLSAGRAAVLVAILLAARQLCAASLEPPPSSATIPLPYDALFDHLDLTRPALIRVSILLKQNDRAAAREALADHFRTRGVRPGFWPRDQRSVQDPDDVAKHVFTFYGSKKFDAGNPIRWNKVYLNDREITYALNRHHHLAVLGSAYQRTRDPRYVRAFAEQVRGWIGQNPGPSPDSWAAWRNLEVASRIGIWTDLFFLFARAPEFSVDDQLSMLWSLHQQAAWLKPQVRPGQGDWSISLATGLAAVAVLFPEFKESTEWREHAYGSLMDDMRNQIYADGSHKALSTHRHNACLSAFWLPFKLALENRVAVPAVYRRTLERMCSYQAYLRRPDGRYPAFNASDPADCRPLLVAATKFFRRADFAYILTYGRTGSAPTSTSCAFRPSGVFVMRDNWTSEANYLAIDAGPYGTAYQHEDKLGLELAAYGRNVLVDPGRYTLDTADPLTRYLASTAAHNTLTVDGNNQQRSRVPASWLREGNSPNRWIGRRAFDYLAAGYTEGYDSAPEVRHFRRVFFLKDKRQPYWIVSDRLVGQGEHTLTARWQFVPAALARHGTAGFATQRAMGNLAICPPDGAASSWTATVLTGSRDPFGGWVSFAYGKIDPAPQVLYEWRTELPATMEYALVPFRDKAEPPVVQSAKAPGGASEDFTALELDFGGFRDVVFIAHDLKSAARKIAGRQTRGCFVVVRTPKDGQPTLLVDADVADAQGVAKNSDE